MAWSPFTSHRGLPSRGAGSRPRAGLARLIRLLPFVALMFGASMFVALNARAAERATSLVGHVRLDAGVPAAGLTVFVTPLDAHTPDGAKTRSAVIDADGTFTLEGVTAGRLAVIVASGEAGALPQGGQIVSVAAGRRNEVTISTGHGRAGHPQSAAATFNFLLYKGEYYNNKTSAGAADPVLVTAPGTTSGIDFDLATGGGTISGKVTADGTSVPLAGLVVFAFGRDSFLFSFDRTDADGNYRISGVPADSFLVGVNALVQLGSSDYVGEYYNNSPNGNNATYVKVAEGQDVTNINFGLAIGGTILGQVTADAGGAGLPNVTVVATGEAPLSQSKATSTDNTGHYALSGLAAGNYKLEFLPGPEYLFEYYNNRAAENVADVVTVAANAATTANAGLAAAGVISGTVTSSATSLPLADIYVVVTKVGDPFSGGAAITAEDGTYSVGGLTSGSYTVGAPELNSWYDNKSDEASATPVNVTAGSTVSNINLSGVPIVIGCSADPGSRVFISGLVSSGGQPVPGAEVDLYFDFSQNPGPAVVPTRFFYESVTTGADGRYLFDCIEESSYFVRCTAGVEDFVGQWYDAADSANATSIAVAPGSSRDDIDFALEHGGKIAGRVTTGGGTGLAGVMVSASNNATGDLYEALTDNSGNYTISSGDSGGLPTGSYTVWTHDFSTADFSLLPVTLSRFEAVPALEGIALEWRTATETEHAGFHVYRADARDGAAVRLTERLITGGPDYRYVDATAQADRGYWYWLGAVDRQGREERLGPVSASIGTPAVSKLLGVFPNPLHAQSVIHFSLATAGKARVQIFDPSGRLVRTLADTEYPAGRAAVTWNGMTDDGSAAHAGVYFVHFSAGAARGTAKVIVAR